jgi:preprotein translocase subunit SecB
MVDKKANGTAAPETQVQAPLVVNAQYVKDLSFENPAPLANIMNNEERPSISIHRPIT